jgi:hypothetical protein
LQQWLVESAIVLRYKYIDCLVACLSHNSHMRNFDELIIIIIIYDFIMQHYLFLILYTASVVK